MNETIGIIPRAFRRRGVWVACTLLLRAGLNFLGLAMLLPVLALVLDPGSLEGGGVLTRAYEGLGFASQRTFALAVCAAVVGVIVLKCLLGLWLARVERTYIYDLYRTLSRRLLVTYHDRGLPFVKASNSAVLARNVNVVCLAFAAGVLKRPSRHCSPWRSSCPRSGSITDWCATASTATGNWKTRRSAKRRGSWPRPSAAMPTSRSTMPSR